MIDCKLGWSECVKFEKHIKRVAWIESREGLKSSRVGLKLESGDETHHETVRRRVRYLWIQRLRGVSLACNWIFLARTEWSTTIEPSVALWTKYNLGVLLFDIVHFCGKKLWGFHLVQTVPYSIRHTNGVRIIKEGISPYLKKTFP